MIKGLDDINESIKNLAHTMPKNEMQRLKWLKETGDEIFNKLSSSGVDGFALIGLLEDVKFRISDRMNKNRGFFGK